MAERRRSGRGPRSRRRERRIVPRGIAHIQSTFNNTIITITDPEGATVAWGSGGSVGFRGTRKSTPYAAGITGDQVARRAMESGMREVEVLIKGPGSGRESAMRALQAAGLAVTSIMDVTPTPHNGPRPRKRRRV